ncbi:MAG: DUF6526 family protein [Gemmatimonadaceae bacterium]
MSQSYKSHARYFPLFHFLASPVTMLWALHAIWHAIRNPSLLHAGQALLAVAISAGVFASRLMALKVQDRVIRLEMRLRLKEVLPAGMHARIPDLTVRQLVALRFAGDAELPTLVERTLKGEFASPRAIKQAITDWQPDYLRA